MSRRGGSAVAERGVHVSERGEGVFEGRERFERVLLAVRERAEAFGEPGGGLGFEALGRRSEDGLPVELHTAGHAREGRRQAEREQEAVQDGVAAGRRAAPECAPPE